MLLTRDVADASALPAAIASGGVIALLALLSLTVAETDEAFANAYSGAVSLQNLVPRAPQRLLVVATTTLGTIGALVLELTSFQSFLFLLGSCFVPLFAVLLADWLAAGRRYEHDDVFASAPVRVGAIVAWVAGFAAYQWLSPTGPAWWVDQVRAPRPAGVGDRRDAAELRRVVRAHGARRRTGASPRRVAVAPRLNNGLNPSGDRAGRLAYDERRRRAEPQRLRPRCPRCGRREPGPPVAPFPPAAG